MELLTLANQIPTNCRLSMADQPALGPNGQLLDTSKIVWYNNPDDDHPIQPTSNMHYSIVSISPCTPMPLSSASEMLQMMLQMMTTSLLLPLMMDQTMTVIPTSYKLVIKRYQVMKLSPVL
jgi:hypothetical protein